jgi:hypothetical protein
MFIVKEKILKRCPSCQGILGVDCFNPDECAWITHEMNNIAKYDGRGYDPPYENEIDKLHNEIADLNIKIDNLISDNYTLKEQVKSLLNPKCSGTFNE